jgi:hypothetical protein
LAPLTKNTLQGFVTLTLSPSGIVLHECSLHQKDGKRWIAFPSKPQIDSEGRLRKDPSTGKPLYSSIVEIIGKEERRSFQTAALAAVEQLLAGGGGTR